MNNKLNSILKKVKQFVVRNKCLAIIFMILIVVMILNFPKTFAGLQPVKSIEILSENIDYNKKEPGSWKVNKSAKWTDKGVAEITFDIDSIMKYSNKNKDVLFVLDISGSMMGDKLNRVKSDVTELINTLLSNDKSNAGLIVFDSTSVIVSEFTNDKDKLIEEVNSLTYNGSTNYYQALVNVDNILKNYVQKKDQECVVLFLTDGFPNEDTPNEIVQYNYLKSQYPFITINGIQYEMGKTILDQIKNVSDNQYIADMDSLENVLFEASIAPTMYENFEIEDYIDTNYFYVESEKDIKASQGKVNFDKDNQKITWIMNNYKSGSKAKMTINARLKKEIDIEGGYYPTNKKEKIKSKIADYKEDVESSKTPVLEDNYKVIYDLNTPDGCKVSGNTPEEKHYSVFDTIEISDSTPTCEGYQFKGWMIVTKGVKMLNDDYFIMPEKDVVIRAIWSKLSIKKSMNGEVSVYLPTVLETYTSNSNYGLHKYKSSITDIIFQDSMSPIYGAIEVLDISEYKNNGVLAYIVPNSDDSTKYTAYIQGEEGVIANSDSSCLFYNFSSLKSIQNLKYFKTFNTTNMSWMFYNCKSLLNLDVSSFNTSKVTTMASMFHNCSSLATLDVSKFDTSKVTTMFRMFDSCRSLLKLEVSHFDTSNVTTMYSMFDSCASLTTLDVSKFDTSKVTTMFRMFRNCNKLTSLDVSKFDTSNVTNMQAMFYNCSKLTSLDVSKFDTSNVIDMSGMFDNLVYLTSLDVSGFDTSKATNIGGMFDSCVALTVLDVSNFDTSNVTDMSYTFYGCQGLTSIDVSNFDTSKVTSMAAMFGYCIKLTRLDLSNFDTSKVTSMGKMFEYCESLINLDLRNFNTSKVRNMSSMFRLCKKLTTTITIANELTYYDEMFYSAATAENTQIIVNYTETVVNEIDTYIGQRYSNSNVIKGKLVTVGT